MKFGVMLPFSGPHASRANIISTALAAEELGYDSVWAYDEQYTGREGTRKHVVCGCIEESKPSDLPTFFEPLVVFSYLAALTKRVTLGTALLILPLANPIVVASQAANIDVLSKGRFVLGVGIGGPSTYSKFRFASMHVPFKQRGAIHDEYVQAIRLLWKKSPATFNGKYIKFNDVELYPKPKNPYIWIGGRGYRRVAELADGWCAPPYAFPEDIENGVARIMEERRKTKRDPRIKVSMTSYICLASDKQKAVDISRNTLVARIRKGAFAGAQDFKDASGMSFLGNVADISEKIERYEDAGVEHLILMFIFRGGMTKLRSDMKAVAEEIMPSFRH